MMQIVTAGRKDTQAFFAQSGILEWEHMPHTPLLAFLVGEDTVRVLIVERPRDLLALADETPVMGQWQGEFRSDFFQFTVREYREHLERRIAPYATAYNVVKRVGPKGGFRSLSFRYVNEKGVDAGTTIATRSAAAWIEDLFQKQNIPVIVEVEP